MTPPVLAKVNVGYEGAYGTPVQAHASRVITVLFSISFEELLIGSSVPYAEKRTGASRRLSLRYGLFRGHCRVVRCKNEMQQPLAGHTLSTHFRRRKRPSLCGL